MHHPATKFNPCVYPTSGRECASAMRTRRRGSSFAPVPPGAPLSGARKSGWLGKVRSTSRSIWAACARMPADAASGFGSRPDGLEDLAVGEDGGAEAAANAMRTSSR